MLLCAIYTNRGWWETEVYIEDFRGVKNIISIRQIVEKHGNLVSSLIPVNALTGCATVSAYDIWYWNNEIRKHSFKA